MVSPTDVYHVFEAIFPLYTALFLAYASLKWLHLFTPEQCAGINKFVASFSVPLLSFQVIAANNIYEMNLNLVLADFSQKVLAVAVLIVFAKVKAGGRLSWVITGLSLSTLPNTLILGIPMLRAMYGVEAAGLLSQIVVMQSLVWYNLLLLLFEINATRGIINNPSNAVNNEEEEVGIEEGEQKEESLHDEAKGMKPTISTTVLIVGKKLIWNPNTHSTLAGLIWASLHFRFGLQLPKIVERSISLLSDGGLGMAMFSLGLFMASQSRLLACGTRKTMLAIAMKFVVGPLTMAGCSAAVGLRGTRLKVAIVQAALPQGIVPFVFAKEYNVHPDILSTGILLGLLIATPIALAYYYSMSLL